MARSTRALSTAGAANANELANAKHEKNEVFMLGEILIFDGLTKVDKDINVCNLWVKVRC